MDQLGCLYFICVFQFILHFYTSLEVFQLERSVFLKEQSYQMYTVGAYYYSKLALDTIVMAFTSMLLTIICYFGVNLTVSPS